MLIPHTLNVSPQPNAENVEINTPIIIQFDSTLSSIRQNNLDSNSKQEDHIITLTHPNQTQDLKQYPPIDWSKDQSIIGKTSFDPSTKTLTFIPYVLLNPNLTYTVAIDYRQFVFLDECDPQQSNSSIISFSFRTSSTQQKSVRIQVQRKGEDVKKLIAIGKEGSLLSELKARITAKFKVHSIGRIYVKSSIPLCSVVDSSNNPNSPSQQQDSLEVLHELTSDRDVYMLKEMDDVLIDGEEDTGSSLVTSTSENTALYKHKELPKLSYEEYVSQHWVPEWAGYYVVCKGTEEEEDAVIQALLNTVNPDYL